MKIFTTIVLFIGIFYWLGYQVYVLNQTSIYAENGILENIQVFTLLVSSLVFLLPVLRQKREDKLVLLFFAFLCFSFILREVDVEKLDIPNVLKFLGAGIGRNTIVATGFMAMITYALFNSTYYKRLAKVLMASKKGLLIVLAAVFLFVGGYFEHIDSIAHHVFLEEMFELSGYVSLLLVALMHSKDTLLASK